VTLPSAVGGVTAADCKAGSAADGSCDGDLTLPSAAGGVTAADCEAGSAAAGSRGSGGGPCGGATTIPRSGSCSCGGDATLPSAAGGATAADCKAGSAAAGSRGSDATVPRALVPGKATDGPAAATTPVAGRGAFQIAVYFCFIAQSSG
jgi:hypothetical protein